MQVQVIGFGGPRYRFTDQAFEAGRSSPVLSQHLASRAAPQNVGDDVIAGSPTLSDLR